KLPRLAALIVVVLRGLLAARRWLRNRQLASHVGATAVVGGDPHADPIQPRAQARTPLEPLELAVHGEEDLLANVGNVRVADAHVTQGSPDEGGIVLENLLDIEGRGQRRGLHGPFRGRIRDVVGSDSKWMLALHLIMEIVARIRRKQKARRLSDGKVMWSARPHP